MMVQDVSINPPSASNNVEAIIETPPEPEENRIDMENFHITTPQEEMEIEAPASQNIPNWNICSKTDVFEVARWHSCKQENYLRGCLFSPDGTCLLTAVNLDGVQVFELPLDLYEKENVKDTRPVSKLQPAVHVKEGQQTTVYDMAWYPGMNSHLPDTCW